MEKYGIRNRDGIDYAFVREPNIDLHRKRWAYKDVDVGRLDNGGLLPTEGNRILSLRDARSDGVEPPVYPEWRSCGASYLLDRIAAQEGIPLQILRPVSATTHAA